MFVGDDENITWRGAYPLGGDKRCTIIIPEYNRRLLVTSLCYLAVSNMTERAVIIIGCVRTLLAS
jgi:hypothetical protein